MDSAEYDAYANWHTVVAGKTVDDLKTIITGSPHVWQPTELPAVVRVFWTNYGKAVIDMGCGLGRNVPVLRSLFTHLLGYDLPPMIRLLRRENPNDYNETSANLSKIVDQSSPYNRVAVFENVVWQHIVWSSGITQNHIDILSKAAHIHSIYSVWNIGVLHQHDFVRYLLSKGCWALQASGDIAEEQLKTIGNVPHKWYLFVKIP